MTAAAATKIPLMTVDEFLVWPGDRYGTIYELVEGVPRARDSIYDVHGTIQARIGAIIAGRCDYDRTGLRVAINPGIQPRLRANWNFRIPDVGVACGPARAGQIITTDPILLVEVLSPSNEDDTWSNIPLYASVPSVAEILIVHSTRVGAELLRRGADQSWPQNPDTIEAGGTIHLASIDLRLPLAEIYRGTDLAAAT